MGPGKRGGGRGAKESAKDASYSSAWTDIN